MRRCPQVLNFFIAYHSRAFVAIADPGAIARNYLKTWFSIDLLCAIPSARTPEAVS